ncbi:protein crowded nuclei 4, partial [Tanacetum coccineum]
VSLTLEKKEWVANYEQMRSNANISELALKRDCAAHVAALAEAKKSEEGLKKALRIEKECVSNIEKALNQMRSECAEAKVGADIKLAEARSMMEEGLKKMTEANAKMQAAEVLEADTSRSRRAAERKLHEVEAREDDIRRQMNSFKSETTEISRLEKELQASRLKLEEEYRILKDEKYIFDLKKVSLDARDEDINRKENESKKKYQELQIEQEKIASKESNRINQALADNEAALKERNSQLEAELETKVKLTDEKIDNKRRASELRELELRQWEDLISEKEHDLEVQARAIGDKENDLSEKLIAVEEKEKSVLVAEKEVALQKTILQKEKDEVNRKRDELQESLRSLDNRANEIFHAEEKVEAMRTETKDLMVLEGRLKEEIDLVRAQKHELEVEADKLKSEREKFETEWELIDEKRDELRLEAERIAEERVTISKFLKDERDVLKLEKDLFRDQYKKDVESLSRDWEIFMKEIEQERSEWFSKIQKERTIFVLDAELQKKELENCIEMKREEIESYLKEKEKAFEEEKKKELEYISSLMEIVAKEAKQVNIEMQRLDEERKAINMDHEKRDKEWAELNSSIEQLKVQRKKLEKQRELLHADREEILGQTEQLKKLEDAKAIEECDSDSRKQSKRFVKRNTKLGLVKKTGGDEVAADGSSIKKDLSNVSLKRRASSYLEQTESNKKRKLQKEGMNLVPHGKFISLSSE